MTTTRRAFLIATGASGVLCAGFGVAPGEHAPLTRTFVIDEDLPGSRILVRRAELTGARITPIAGDVGWLWFERLSRDAMTSPHAIGGLTRGADAFILTQLGAGIGMRATRRVLDGGAVLWMLEHGRNVPTVSNSAHIAHVATQSGSLK